MLEEGYGAVSARRVAAAAEVTLGLVHYYFGPMENLLLEVFRRRADWMLEREAEALATDQPLWALWDITREQANTPLNIEFLALGNHYQAVHDEVCAYSTRFRRLQYERVSKSLADRQVDTTRFPPEGALLLIDGMSRFLGSETMYGMSFGHREAAKIVERLITEIEGPRKRRRSLKR
jgi:AcrR family transcriptional regulator